MYSCCSGTCFLKPASTCSWLAKYSIATAIAFETGTGETPMLAGVVPAGDDAFLVIGDKGADFHRPK